MWNKVLQKKRKSSFKMPNSVSNEISVTGKSHDFERIRLIKCTDIFIWKSAQLPAQNWDNFVTTLSENTCKSDSCPSLQFTDPFDCQMQCTKVAQKAIRDWLGGLINLFKLQITAKQSCNIFLGETVCLRLIFKKKGLSSQNDKIHAICSLVFLRSN